MNADGDNNTLAQPRHKLNKENESTKIQYSKAMFQMKHEIRLKDMEIASYEERNQLNQKV